MPHNLGVIAPIGGNRRSGALALPRLGHYRRPYSTSSAGTKFLLAEGFDEMSTRPSSVNTLADYLATGYWQDNGQSPHKFSGHSITVDLTGLGNAGKALARAALDAWSDVADLQFRERRSGADITFKDAGDSADTEVRMSGHTTRSAEVNIGAAWLEKYGKSVGSYGFQTYIHEIGHALGLGHAGDYNGGASIRQARFVSDSWQTTVMSYFDQDENKSIAATKAYLTTPMAADILAIQKLYGKAHNGDTAGATTWGNKISLNNTAMTIWDEGGNDTLDLTRNRFDNRVDLAGGSYSDVGAYDGRHQIANLGIAEGTVIENLSMGGGNDKVAGNQAANVIRLGKGDDSADGKEGNDTLDGQDGNDTLTGGLGADSFVFTKGADTVTDFEDDQDTIVLSRELWGGQTPSVQDVLAAAHVEGDAVVFDFGRGNTLRIEHVTDINALADDLAFV